MTIDTLRRIETDVLRDRQITEDEAVRLVASTYDWGAFSQEERTELKALLARDHARMTPAAVLTVERFLGAREASAPVIASTTGALPSTFADDRVHLGRDGSVHGTSGVTGYSRGYDATQQGPLRFRHGTPAPTSAFVGGLENARVRTSSPGEALDSAARAFGVRGTGFQTMASSKQFFDPKAEFWWGKCHAWAWSALDDRISRQVDGNGQGVWIGGEWISRADLGNWMMATADTISLSDQNRLFQDKLTATDLLHGTTQYLMHGGGGVVADIHNDAKKGKKEVWNQPFVSSDLTTRTLEGPAAIAVLRQAKRDGAVRGVAVKHVAITGTYAVERGDGWEGAVGTSAKKWNLYAVTDARGQVLTAYMADDPKLKGVGSLPTKKTDDLPEYFWKPRLQAIDDVLEGRRNASVANDAHGDEFTFFVGTVLTKGVPANVRAGFEAEVRAGETDAVALSRKYPGVANAYSPEQWRRLFAPRGFNARQFGAAWP